ncbi:ABC transporter substrate-binding protein [Nesterenkonia alkaliphila]|uniref:Extracellular solute-binding protein n=1 Tax=Nesterenkonia alkaliphila TaxID=1463631 RepID=A0A7K1UF09_9MICC|nr:extracellular solute-binding protein [Nesterenkonia alkaliphila]MVT25057.1 extracellular solute-binding protein [Nesterenkonia alkaliphila]GFZ97408.1 sugar ABC transporter substrate-binding protein [Nesterenkonia alkaliphila]
MTQQIRRTAAASAALVLGVTACGGGSENAEATAWVLNGGVWPVVEEDIQGWSEENPDHAIQSESFANDVYKERIRLAVGSGEAPTLIVGWTGGTLLEYVEGDYVLDITEETAELNERLIDSVAENGIVDGATYAVPMNNVQPVVLYYNQDVFDEVGAEVPTDWDEMLTVIAEFNEAGVYPFALAGSSLWPMLMWSAYLTDRIGGPEAFEAVVAGEADAWSHPAIIEAIERIQELEQRGAFDPNYTGLSADQNEDAHLMADGHAAMLLQGSWVYSRLLDEQPDFVASGALGVTGFPSIPGGEGHPDSVVGNPANFWSVSTDASEEEQEAALSYLSEHLFNDEYVDQMLATGNIPPLEGLEDQIAEAENSEFLSFVYESVQEAPSFQLSWDQAVDPSQEQALLENLDLAFQGQITPEEFAENMNATQPGAE